MTDPQFEKLLERLGPFQEYVRTVKFGGPVGKAALVGIAGILALGAIGWNTANVTVQMMAVCLIAFLVALVAALMTWFAHKHPTEATLDGAEVVASMAIRHSTKGDDIEGFIEPEVRALPPAASSEEMK